MKEENSTPAPYFHASWQQETSCWSCRLCSFHSNFLEYLKEHLLETHRIKRPKVDHVKTGKQHEKRLARAMKALRKLQAQAEPENPVQEHHQVISQDLFCDPFWLDKLQDNMSRHISYDEINRLVIYKIYCSAFALKKPINAYIKAGYSTGKSFLVGEVARYIPRSCISFLEGMTEKAMYYEQTVEEDGKTIIDLSGKIWVFIDLKEVEMIRMLRAMMSHDSYLRQYKTVIDQETKVIWLRGYACVVFCTADPAWDEEFSTRAIMLSPEDSQEKIEAAMMMFAHNQSFEDSVVPEPYTLTLQKLIEQRTEPVFHEAQDRMREVIAMIKDKRKLVARDMRDWKGLFRLALVTAWLKAGSRPEQEDGIAMVTAEDWEECLGEFAHIMASTTSGVSAEQLKFARQFPVGLRLTMRDIVAWYQKTFHQWRDRTTIADKFLKPLCGSGYLIQEKDETDRRRWLYYRPAELPEIELRLVNDSTVGDPEKPTQLKSGEKREPQITGTENAPNVGNTGLPASKLCVEKEGKDGSMSFPCPVCRTIHPANEDCHQKEPVSSTKAPEGDRTE